MNRRSAIKNISIGMGLSVSAGTVMTMISSCQTEPTTAGDSWVGKFLTDKDQLAFIENLADIILPRTETPGAKDIGIIKYIDMTLNEVYTPEDQERFRKGMALCISKIEAEQGGAFAKLKKGKLSAFLNQYIGAKADKKTYDDIVDLIEDDELPTDKNQLDTYHFYNFLLAVKSLTIGGYYGSQLIATEHLAYDPVPGPFIGCIDYPDGNVYAL